MLDGADIREHVAALLFRLWVLVRSKAASMSQLVLYSLGTSLRLFPSDALDKFPHLLGVTACILHCEAELDRALQVVDPLNRH